jgi:hypothetical protein
MEGLIKPLPHHILACTSFTHDPTILCSWEGLQYRPCFLAEPIVNASDHQVNISLIQIVAENGVASEECPLSYAWSSLSSKERYEHS